VCRDNGECADRPETWEDRKTGQVFSRSDFQGHRTVHAIIGAVLVFGYGLIGCAAFAYFKHSGDREKFFEIFKTWAIFAAVFSVSVFLSAWA
jgi:ABC-type spermidine/putrescine transport system permease subunit II